MIISNLKKEIYLFYSFSYSANIMHNMGYTFFNYMKILQFKCRVHEV
jgi:hypothetical protein